MGLVVYEVSPTGVVGTKALFNGFAMNLALDAQSNLYVTSVGCVSKAIAPEESGQCNGGFSGDGGPATSATLNGPFGMAFDSSGNLYVADSGNGRIREITPGNVISTVAGNGIYRFAATGSLRQARCLVSQLEWRQTTPATCTSQTNSTIASARYQGVL
jgi:hypothetical protein